METAAVIVAAGQGVRFGSPKHRALLGGRPLLEWSLEAFQETPEISSLVLVLQEPSMGNHYRRRFPKLKALVAGGVERQDSVRCGFQELSQQPPDIVLIHDGARPLAGRSLIQRVIRAVSESGAAVPVIPVEDTLKEVEKDLVQGTLDRSRLFRSQTPQGFRYTWLKEGLEAARREGYTGTDEAVLMERLGREVRVVPGERRNLKITVPEDLKMAEVYLERA